MSQLNVDVIRNRAGTGGPTTPSLNVTGSLNVGNITSQTGLNISGIVTATSFNSPSGGLNVSGVSTATRFVSTVATGTAPITVSSTTKVSNLNCDLLDDQDSTYYTNATNLNAGTVPSAQLATGTANIDTFLRGDRSWASITSYSDYGSLEQVSGNTRKSISAIYTLNGRYSDAYYGWTTSGPWTTFYTYGGGGQTDAEQASWMGLGFVPNSSYGTYLSNSENRVRQQILTNGNNIGPQGPHDMFYFSTNQYCYAPISIMTIPIRNNHPSLSKTITIYGAYCSYWCSGYDGSSSWVYTPGQNGTYNISSGTWTTKAALSGTSTSATTYSWSVTIPAQTTVVFMSMATLLYYSASSSSIQYFEMNKLYNLSTTFTDPYIQVDSRMINTMRFADWQRYGLTASTYQFYKVYNACADMYGNR